MIVEIVAIAVEHTISLILELQCTVLYFVQRLLSWQMNTSKVLKGLRLFF